MIDAGKDIEPMFFGVLFEPIHGFLGREGALHRNKTICAEGERRHSKQQREDNG
jgi:hypothetical protein